MHTFYLTRDSSDGSTNASTQRIDRESDEEGKGKNISGVGLKEMYRSCPKMKSKRQDAVDFGRRNDKVLKTIDRKGKVSEN